MTRLTWNSVLGLLGLSAICHAQTYTITTAAGGANPYFYTGTGDGGPASKAGLANLCYDVSTDAAGNLYIVAGSLIRKVTPAGIISTIAGGGTALEDSIPATKAQISPLAIAADIAGYVFIADTAVGNTRIRLVSPGGTITTVAGGAQCCTLGDGGPALGAYIGIPYGLALDTTGNIYIAQRDGKNNLVRKISATTGTITTVAGGGSGSGDGGQATTVSLAQPTGVAVDLVGNLYIAETGANRIRKVSPGGVISTVAAIDSPWHVAVDTGGNLYVTQINDAKVALITPAGTVATIAGTGTHGYSGDAGPATSATLDRPAGIAVANCISNVYIADATSGTARVRQLTPPVSINASGVVPVYSSVNSIQAGSWISIYGTGLAGGTTLWNGDFPLSLGNTSVTINSKPGYLWFVSPGQINVQAPDDNTNGTVSVAVTTASGSAYCSVTLAPYAPSLSLFNSRYPAAIVATPGQPGNSGAGYDYIGPVNAFPFPSRPAKAGETVVLFGVGFGPTTTPVPAGHLYSGAAPSVTPPQIAIGGAQAGVTFAGIVGAGLYQFNFVVPKAASGDQTLNVTVNGVAAPSGVYLTLQ